MIFNIITKAFFFLSSLGIPVAADNYRGFAF